jgi:predicted ATP-grasp superfamily ATP-dependent carboligase
MAGEANQLKCKDNMHRITIELTGKNSLKALQDLEHNHLIRILQEPDLNSYSLSGEPISNEDFRKWVEYAENSPTVSLNEAKQRWTQQKKSLQKLIR